MEKSNEVKTKEYLENLPSYLTRNLGLIGQLDSRVKNSLVELDKLKVEHLPKLIYYDAKSKELAVSLINLKYDECKCLSEEKIQIANQTYDLIDRYIRKLDSEINIFKDVIDYYVTYDEKELDEAAALSPFKYSMEREEKKRKSDDEDYGEEIEKESLLDLPEDLPIDPNEPRYCVCNRVSFGEMIACDNPECPVEWFHMGCMKLNSRNKPKGQWFCPTCRKDQGGTKKRKSK